MKRKKIYWIVGASSGIGAELTRKLAAQGHYVIASARKKQALEELVKEFPNNVHALTWDVCNEDEPLLNSSLLNETDVIDQLIYCAGICEYDDGPKLDAALYSRVMDTNFLGMVRIVKAALPLLKRSKNNPRIVGVSSLAACVAFPRAEIYGASKAAMEYFLQALKIDLRETKIGVSIVRPGFVDTPLTRKNDFEMPMLMTVEKAADEIIKGLEKNKLFVQFPGGLSWPLNFARLIPHFWLNSIAPKFRKMETL